MLRIVLTSMLIAVLALGAGFAYLLWRGEEPGGIDDAYVLVFGPADRGPVDFERISRTSAPHDALACPEGACGEARVDIVTPVYPVDGARLRAILREVARGQPGTQLVYSARWEEADRFIVRSRIMRFPDTVNARVFGAGEGRSTLALYSRSQIGYSDMGVNKERLRRWLAEIDERVRVTAQP
jgi:uncharacterized protein (DUF1499 family)